MGASKVSSREAPDLDPEVVKSLLYFRTAFAHPPNTPQTDRQREWVHGAITQAAEYLVVGGRDANEQALDVLYGVDMFRLARAMHERPANMVATERLRRLRTAYNDCVSTAMPPLLLIPSHGHPEAVTFDVFDEDLDYGSSELTEIIDGTARVLLQTLVSDADHELPRPDALADAEPFVQTLYGFWFGTAYYYLSRAEDFVPPAPPLAVAIEPPQAA